MQPDLTFLTTAPPTGLAVGFGLITLLTLLGFTWAMRHLRPSTRLLTTGFLLLWLLVLGIMAQRGFFTTLNTTPPRLMPVILIPLLAIIALFSLPAGRRFVDTLSLPALTYLHTLRFPVELVLYGLYVAHQVPSEMTFEGRNFDIAVGLTAPFVAYFSFRKPTVPKRGLLVWNIGGLLSLINIVGIAILAAPTPLQQLAFQQPNVAVLKFPFVWLPGFVVPAMLLSHLVTFRQLRRSSVPVV